MPIRYVQTFTYPEGLTAEEKVPANAVITEEAFTISDEEAAREAEQAVVNDELLVKGRQALANWGSLTQAQKNGVTKELFRAFLLEHGR